MFLRKDNHIFLTFYSINKLDVQLINSRYLIFSATSLKSKKKIYNNITGTQCRNSSSTPVSDIEKTTPKRLNNNNNNET